MTPWRALCGDREHRRPRRELSRSRSSLTTSGASPRRARLGGVPFKLSFDSAVGQRERHVIGFSFDRISGQVRITIDGNPVIQKYLLLSTSSISEFNFEVGLAERHRVVIQIERKWLFAPLRPLVCRLFIDGK